MGGEVERAGAVVARAEEVVERVARAFVRVVRVTGWAGGGESGGVGGVNFGTREAFGLPVVVSEGSRVLWRFGSRGSCLGGLGLRGAKVFGRGVGAGEEVVGVSGSVVGVVVSVGGVSSSS